MNLGTDNLGINLFGKLVFVSDDRKYIYRVEPGDGIQLRIALKKLAKKFGISDLFGEEEIIGGNDIYTISKQKLYRKITDISDFPLSDESFDHLSGKNEETQRITGKIILDYTDKIDTIRTFFDDFKLGWFDSRNCGLDDNNRIVIFDYLGQFNFVGGSQNRVLYYKGGSPHEIDVT